MGKQYMEIKNGFFNLIKSFSIDTDTYSVDFEYIPMSENPPSSHTVFTPINVLTRIKNNTTGQSIKGSFHILDVPAETSMGYKMDGTLYTMMGVDKRSPGWYIVDKKENGQMYKIMEFVPSRGMRITCNARYSEITTILGSPKNTGKRRPVKINIGIFLKAITGKSYKELIRLLGKKNRFVLSTLVDELPRDECIRITMESLVPSYKALSVDSLFKELNRRLYSKNFMDCGEARGRTLRNISFTSRALGKELAKDVLNYKKGVVLTDSILKEIDSSEVDTIYVRHDGKIFELKKYKFPEENLSEQELLTVVNMYACALDGYPTTDLRYELYNRKTDTYKDTVYDKIGSMLTTILNNISNYFLSNGEEADLTKLPPVQLNVKELIQDLKKSAKDSQTSETTNFAALYAKRAKVVTDYNGRSSDEMVRVKDSELGIYDPYQMPESNQVGLVHYLTLMAEKTKDSDGITSSYKGAYVKVNEGKVVPGKVLLRPDEIVSSYIAPWETDLSKSIVPAYFNGVVVKVPVEKVQYQEYCCFNNLSYSTANIPLLNFSDGKRLVMGGNQDKQAIACLVNERPIVSTGTTGVFGLGVVKCRDILSSHYIANQQNMKMSYEDFIELPLKLIKTNTDVPGYRKLIFCVQTTEYINKTDREGNSNKNIEYTVVFCKRTTENSLIQYNINPASDWIYQGNDIVVYGSSFDIDKYNLDYKIATGNMKIDDYSIFDVEKATGNNFRVGFKTWLSSCLDDSFVISAGLLGTNKTASVCLNEIKYELKDKDDSIESYGIKSYVRGINSNGLPSIGTQLKPRDVVIGKYVTTSNGIVKDTSIRLDQVTEGEVVYATITGGKYATVLLASILDSEVGDKWTGDHGNKGTIGKIVPESQMPFDSSGVPLDALLNPLGLPSRMNLSQLLQGVLGMALRKEGKNRGIVITPQFPNALDVVKEYADKNGVKPEYLYDGRTGRRFDRPSSVVMMYMKKLSHTSTSKSNSTNLSTNLDPVTGQPKKGKKIGGGQKFGEMEFWTLASVGAFTLMQDLQSIQSDDISSRNSIKYYYEKGTESILSSKNNNNDSATYVPLRSMGIDLVNGDNGDYKLKIMKDSDICALSSKPPIDNTPSSLHKEDVFGVCNSTKFLPKNRQKWGYIDLKCEIIHPVWIYKGKVPKLLIVVELYIDNKGYPTSRKIALSTSILRDMIEGKAFVCKNGNKLLYTKDNNIIGYEWESGIESVVNLFKYCKLEDAIDYYVEKLDNMMLPSDKDVFDIKQILSIAKYLKEEDFELSDFVISHLPIMPRVFRLPVDGRSADFDVHYKNIMSSVEANKNIGRATDVYKKIVAFVGLDKKYALPAEKGCKTLLSFFVGKESDKHHGFLRDSVQSKVISQSFRSVISPSEAGQIKPYEIGMPFILAVNALRDYIKPYIKNNFSYLQGPNNDKALDSLIDAMINEDVSSVAKILMIQSKLEAKDTLRNLKAGVTSYIQTNKPVIFGRQPTLHQFGERAYRVVLIDGVAIKIHPLTCKGYNADFDGDQGYGLFPISESAGIEALKTLSPTSKMYNPKDGSFVLEPTQDILLGCYLSTMLFENKLRVDDYEESSPYYNAYSEDNIYYYGNLDLLKYDIEFSRIKYQNLVCYTHSNGNKYLSTAGRILFNSIIPGGFTDEPFTNTLGLPISSESGIKELKYDGLIRKSGDMKKLPNGRIFREYSMKKIVTNICDTLDNNKMTCDILDDILVYGVTACDMSGISLGLDDYIEHPMIDPMIEKSEILVSRIRKYYDLGLTTEQDRKEASAKIYNHMCSYIRGTLLDYYDRNNNLFIIMDSGARGNLSQLMNTCGIIGSISRTNSESLETPVLSNYLRGLSSSDQMLVSYGTRMGISSVQNDTEIAGALSRGAVYNLSGFKIVEHDCGNTESEMKVLYTDEIVDCKLNGELIDIEDLVGRSIDDYDSNINKYIHISGKEISYNTIYFIQKNNIREIKLIDGIVTIRYKLSKMFRDLAESRIAKGLPYLKVSEFSEKHPSKDGIVTGIMTTKTLDYVENKNLETIKIRTMLDCKSVGGVCSKCYGIENSTKKYPKVGEMIGVVAAQSIGESALQGNMSVINAGGKAGASIASGVNAFKSRVNGSTPNYGNKCIVSRSSDYVSIKDLGKNSVLVQFDGTSLHKYKVDKSECLVKDGEFVKKGDLITSGVLDVNDIHLDSMDETIKRRQIELLQIFNDIFAGNDVKINIKHFECIVRAQTCLVRIKSSSDAEFPEGSLQFYQKVLKHPESNIDYYHKIESTQNVLNKLGGFVSTLSYYDFAETIASTALDKNKQSSENNSFLGKIIVGQDLTSNKSKNLNTLQYETIDSVSVDKSMSMRDIDSLIKVNKIQENLASLSELNLMDLLEKEVSDVKALDEVAMELIDDKELDIDTSNAFNTDSDIDSTPSKQSSSDYTNVNKLNRSNSF